MDKELSKNSPEVPIPSLVDLAAKLGVSESRQVTDLKQKLLTSEGQDFIEAMTSYQTRAQIALILLTADIYRQRGDQASLEDSLQSALDYADNMGYEDLVSEIKELLKSL